MADTVQMPKLGFDMAEGKLVRWVKSEGEKVNKGEVLAEIETDKATVEVESQFTGVMLKHLVEENTSVPVGDAIAVIGQPGESVAAPAAGTSPAPAQTAVPQPKPAPVMPAFEPISAAPVTIGPVKASPLARRIAGDSGLDIRTVRGTGATTSGNKKRNTPPRWASCCTAKRAPT